MNFPALTSAYAGILALIYLLLSAWVVAGRAKFRINHGDGGQEQLNRRIRAHANFAEYVPFILFLTALLDGAGAGRSTIHALLLTLVVARLMHPIGMVARLASPQQFIFRGASMMATWLVLLASAVLLLIRVL